MIADIFGPDIFVAFVLIVISLAAIVVPIFAVIDAARRPGPAFAAAGSSKGLWIAVIVVFTLLTGVVGLILACIYLASVRPKVRALAG